MWHFRDNRQRSRCAHAGSAFRVLTLLSAKERGVLFTGRTTVSSSSTAIARCRRVTDRISVRRFFRSTNTPSNPRKGPLTIRTLSSGRRNSAGSTPTPYSTLRRTPSISAGSTGDWSIARYRRFGELQEHSRRPTSAPEAPDKKCTRRIMAG